MTPVSSVEEKRYSLKEVAQHNKEGDAWIIIDNKIYDISKFVHPGGFQALSPYVGGDGTQRFYRIHVDPTGNLSRLTKFFIGRLVHNELKISIP